MLLFRHARATSVVGQRARQFLAPFIARSTPSLVSHTFPQQVTSIRSQRRLNSTDAADSLPKSSPSTPASPGDGSDIPGLAPYKLRHLHEEEQHAYRTHGPNYVEHFGPKDKSWAKHSANRRAAFAVIAKERLGSNWLAAMDACNDDKIFRAERDAKYIAFSRRRKMLKTEMLKAAENADIVEYAELEQALIDETLAFKEQEKKERWAYLKAAAEQIQSSSSEDVAGHNPST